MSLVCQGTVLKNNINHANEVLCLLLVEFIILFLFEAIYKMDITSFGYRFLDMYAHRLVYLYSGGLVMCSSTYGP